jgi:predicted peptidase
MHNSKTTFVLVHGAWAESILLATQRPINGQCIQEKAPRPLWKDKPVWFLVAENDRMIPAKTQHFQAKRMKAIVRAHAVDHANAYRPRRCNRHSP